MGTEMASASGPFNPTAKRFDINYFFFADSSCRFFLTVGPFVQLACIAWGTEVLLEKRTLNLRSRRGTVANLTCGSSVD
jgi:hypothetical protein